MWISEYKINRIVSPNTDPSSFVDIQLRAICMNKIKLSLRVLSVKFPVTFHRHAAVFTLFNDCQLIKVPQIIRVGMEGGTVVQNVHGTYFESVE